MNSVDNCRFSYSVGIYDATRFNFSGTQEISLFCRQAAILVFNFFKFQIQLDMSHSSKKTRTDLGDRFLGRNRAVSLVS
jgi:hypothetical protein